MAKSDKADSGTDLPPEAEAPPTGPFAQASGDFNRVASPDAKLPERVGGLEALLNDVVGFLAWLFPGHAVPGTDRAQDRSAPGPLQGQPADQANPVDQGGTIQTPGTLTAGLGAPPA